MLGESLLNSLFASSISLTSFLLTCDVSLLFLFPCHFHVCPPSFFFVCGCVACDSVFICIFRLFGDSV